MVEKLTRCHGAAQHRQASGTSVLYSLAARYAFFRIPRSAATSDLVKFARVLIASRSRAASRSSRRVARTSVRARRERTLFHFFALSP